MPNIRRLASRRKSLEAAVFWKSELSSVRYTLVFFVLFIISEIKLFHQRACRCGHKLANKLNSAVAFFIIP